MVRVLLSAVNEAQCARCARQIPMHNHIRMTIECFIALFRYACELPSAEYILVDDGSLEDVEELKVFLRFMKTHFDLRIKFHRQHMGVGYASIMTQAAQLAEGTFLMLLNNDGGW